MRSIKKNCSSNEATWNGVSEGKGRFPYFNTGEKKKKITTLKRHRGKDLFSALFLRVSTSTQIILRTT